MKGEIEAAEEPVPLVHDGELEPGSRRRLDGAGCEAGEGVGLRERIGELGKRRSDRGVFYGRDHGRSVARPEGPQPDPAATGQGRDETAGRDAEGPGLPHAWWRRTGTDLVEDEARHHGVPEAPVAARPLPSEPSLLHEAEVCVERPSGHVVGPDLERELVGAVAPRPVDAGLEERATDAAAAMPFPDRHAELRDAGPELDLEEPDDRRLPLRYRHPVPKCHEHCGTIRSCDLPAERLRLRIPVEWRLGTEPEPLAGDRLVQCHHGWNVTRDRSSDRGPSPSGSLRCRTQAGQFRTRPVWRRPRSLSFGTRSLRSPSRYLRFWARSLRFPSRSPRHPPSVLESRTSSRRKGNPVTGSPPPPGPAVGGSPYASAVRPTTVAVEGIGLLAQPDVAGLGRRWSPTLGLEPAAVVPLALAAARDRSPSDAARRLAASTRVDTGTASQILEDLARSARLDPLVEDLLHSVHQVAAIAIVDSTCVELERNPTFARRLAPIVDLVLRPGTAGTARGEPGADASPPGARVGQRSAWGTAAPSSAGPGAGARSAGGLRGLEQLVTLGDGDPARCLVLAGSAELADAARALGMIGARCSDGVGAAEAVGTGFALSERTYRAAGGVVVDDGQVLVLHRGDRGEVRLPKGHVEPGESDEVAACREVREETGYCHAVVTDDLGVHRVDFPRFKSSGEGAFVHRLEHFFLCHLRDSEVEARAPEELVFRPNWLPIEAACEELTYAVERAWVQAARDRLAGGDA